MYSFWFHVFLFYPFLLPCFVSVNVLLGCSKNCLCYSLCDNLTPSVSITNSHLPSLLLHPSGCSGMMGWGLNWAGGCVYGLLYWRLLLYFALTHQLPFHVMEICGKTNNIQEVMQVFKHQSPQREKGPAHMYGSPPPISLCSSHRWVNTHISTV